MHDTITFELSRGYVDDDGKAHKKVTLRPGRIDDEIKADRRCALKTTAKKDEVRAESQSTVLWEMEVASCCIVRLGDIIEVTSDHLRAMSRADGRLILKKLRDLDVALEEVERDPNSRTGEPEPSNSPS